MRNDSPLLDKAILARLDRLKLQTRRSVQGTYAGRHRSHRRGVSVEFAEHRQYSPGDDLRYVDWKAFGRTDKVYVKQYEEETDLACWILVDASASMSYGGTRSGISKLRYASSLAAALAHIVLRQQDRAGLIVFDRQIRHEVRPAGHPSHIQQIVQTLESADVQGETRAGEVLNDLAQRIPRRGMVVLISDLLDDLPQTVEGLRHLRHRHHEVVVFQVLDRDELELPFYKTSRFLGLEQNGEWTVDPNRLRTAYVSLVRQYLLDVRKSIQGLHADYCLTTSDESVDRVLSRFLSERVSAGFT